MADIVTSRQFTDGERGITAQKLNDIVGSSTIQPAFYTSKPTAPSADPADIALILKAGAYAQVPISALAGSATQAQIWDTRLRSFNAVGNPNFGVDQRVCGGTGNYGGAGNITFFQCDRWQISNSAATGRNSAQKQTFSTGAVKIPGTNYYITNSILTFNLTTAQASLAAAEYLVLMQYVEGPQLRELIGDVHSISLLVASSTALNFSVFLRSVDGKYSLTKLCSVPGGNVYTLVTLPNLPVWAPGGTWDTSPGAQGYYIGICLGAGSDWTGPADTWQNSTNGFFAATGTDNWFSKPVNSTFDIAFVQHEPGPLCTTLMDKPFTQNLDECLRYYAKSYIYNMVAGTVSNNGIAAWISILNSSVGNGNVSFPKPMAEVPTVTLYNFATGAANNIQGSDAANRGVTAANIGQIGFDAVNFGATVSGSVILSHQGHWVADTGW